jgi:hypothetical protein
MGVAGDLLIASRTDVAANIRFITGTTPAERMRIDSSGNVGIGTASNGRRLEVWSGAAQTDVLAGSTSSGFGTVMRWDNSAGLGYLYNTGAYPLLFGTNSAERMRISAGGDVGVGTSSANNRLQSAYPVPASVPSAGAGAHGLAVGSTGFGLAAGALNSGNAYLQATRWDGTAVNYNIVLQPNGGNVGIGTSSPGSRLDVASTTDGDTIRVSFPSAATGSTGGGIQFRAFTNSAVLVEQGRIQTICTDGSASYGGDMRFMTAGSGALAERMRINQSGNVGIGTSSPTSKLTVEGGVSAAGIFDALTLRNSLDGGVGLYFDNSVSTNLASIEARVTSAGAGTDDGILAFSTATNGTNSERMRIDASGNVLIGVTSQSTWSERFNVTTSGTATAYFNSSSASGGYTVYAASGTTYGFIGTASGIIGSGGSNVLAVRSENALAFASGGATERMRIDSAGALLVNTTGAAYSFSGRGLIELDGSFDSLINLKLNGVPRMYFQASTSGDGYINTPANSLILQTGAPSTSIQFHTNNTERMRINSDGRLLLGTTSSVIAGADNKFIVLDNFQSQFGMSLASTQTSGTAYFTNFVYNGTAVGSITGTSTTTTYATSSDVRLKENITDADDAASLIDAIQVRKFDWKADGSHQRYGFVAQELVTVAPEAVHNPADPDDMMGVDYSKLVPMLVKEIQSLRARVAQLEGN